MSARFKSSIKGSSAPGTGLDFRSRRSFLCKQVRDILFATDVASAFLAFFERGSAGAYNVGGGTENAISLLECIALIDFEAREN